MRFLRLLAAVAALPFCVALGWAFLDTIGALSAARADGPLFSAETLSLAGGFAAFFLAWTALPRPTRAYVLGHELTHAIWGLAFGARVSRLKVTDRGGSVNLTKSNVWITLAPYFFPFYTIAVLLAAGAVRLFVSPLPCMCAWLFAIGFTWSFHACFTIQTLMERQPDVQEYGRLFSWTFIWIANMAGIFAWLCAVTSANVRPVLSAVAHRTAACYGALYELVRSLPFLPQ